MFWARRFVRSLMIFAAAGFLPAFVMRCDKAALNFQHGLFQGLGMEASDLFASQLPAP